MLYIATLHGDLNGIERQKRIIRNLRIQTKKELVVTIENPSDETISEAKEKIDLAVFNRILPATLIEEEALRYLRTKIAENFAYEVRTLLEERRVKTIFVDMPEIKEFNAKIVPFERTVFPKEELFSRYNDAIDKLYCGNATQEDIFALTGEKITFDASNDFLERRERYIAERIKEEKPDAHIGGLNHVYGFNGFGIKCLWELTKKQGDIRMKLYEG